MAVSDADVLESTFIARRGRGIARCLEALRFEPNEPFVLWVLGRSYTMKGMNDQAVAQFERGLQAVENNGPSPPPAFGFSQVSATPTRWRAGGTTR